MSTHLHHRIRIGRPPAEVFAYVTQPWRWREWHPSSLGAEAAGQAKDDPLAAIPVGAQFVERILLQPLSPLPLRLLRTATYVVEQSQLPCLWQVRGQLQDGWLRLRYELAPDGDNATRFERTLEYAATGLSRFWAPLLRKRTESLSKLALARLQQRLENHAPS